MSEVTAILQSNALIFDELEPITIPVTLKTKDGVKNFTLHEASGKAVRKWRNAQIGKAKWVGGKFVGPGEIAESDITLIAQCLKDEQGKLVPFEVIGSWKNPTIDGIFKILKKISHIDAELSAKELEERIAEDTEKLAELKSEDSFPKEPLNDTSNGSD
jgi:hypothetical protein